MYFAAARQEILVQCSKEPDLRVKFSPQDDTTKQFSHVSNHVTLFTIKK